MKFFKKKLKKNKKKKNNEIFNFNEKEFVQLRTLYTKENTTKTSNTLYFYY